MRIEDFNVPMGLDTYDMAAECLASEGTMVYRN